jgi:hypothetical protein
LTQALETGQFPHTVEDVNITKEYFYEFVPVSFLWNFFISREAATAERRYEKERKSGIYMHVAAFGARTNLFSLPSLPSPSHSSPPPL